MGVVQTTAVIGLLKEYTITLGVYWVTRPWLQPSAQYEQCFPLKHVAVIGYVYIE